MGWNKNTHRDQHLALTEVALRSVGVRCERTILGWVRGRGLNDAHDKHYELLQIAYTDGAGDIQILREQMQRSHDCDADDAIVTLVFTNTLAATLEATPIDITAHDDDFCRNSVHHDRCAPYTVNPAERPLLVSRS